MSATLNMNAINVLIEGMLEQLWDHGEGVFHSFPKSPLKKLLFVLHLRHPLVSMRTSHEMPKAVWRGGFCCCWDGERERGRTDLFPPSPLLLRLLRLTLSLHLHH